MADATMERLGNLDPALTDLTLDQLRTLVFLNEHKVPSRAASRLHRDQSSVHKQLKVLNDRIEKLCGEKVAVSIERGKYEMTETGRMLALAAKRCLSSLSESVNERRRACSGELLLTATAFSLVAIARELPRIREVFPGVAINVSQVRSNAVWNKLREGELDFAVAAIGCYRNDTGGWSPILPCDDNGNPEDFSLIDHVAWSHEEISLVTNLSEDRLRRSGVTVKDIAESRVIRPKAGFMRDVSERILGEQGLAEDLEVPIGDVYFGLNLLLYGIVEGVMLVHETVWRWLEVVRNAAEKDGEAREVHLITDLSDEFRRFRIMTALFRRTRTAESLGKEHAATKLWNYFLERSYKL